MLLLLVWQLNFFHCHTFLVQCLDTNLNILSLSSMVILRRHNYILQKNYFLFSYFCFQHCPQMMKSSTERSGWNEAQHVVETSPTRLAHAKLPLKFWYEAFSTTVFLINDMSIAMFRFISLFEKLYHKKPNYSFVKTLGCAFPVYVITQNKNSIFSPPNASS